VNLKRIINAMLIPLCVACLDVMAHSKTDIVTLFNGDRITGEIKQLDGGILVLSTDSMAPSGLSGRRSQIWRASTTLNSN